MVQHLRLTLFALLFSGLCAEFGTAQSRNVFVWDGHPVNLSGTAWKNFLQAGGHTVYYPPVDSTLPTDYSQYDAVFLNFGIYSNNHYVQNSESQALLNYWNNGGRLYLEGGDAFNYDAGGTELREILSCFPGSDGSSITVNSTTPMAGAGGTITSGMSFEGYSGGNSWIDQFVPDQSQVVLTNNGLNFGVVSERAVGISFELAGLVNGTGVTNTDTLMSHIFNYLFTPSYRPRNLTVASGNGQATLTWTRPLTTTNFHRYRIYGGTSANPTTQIDSTAAGDVNDTTKVIMPLGNDTLYYFRVTGVDNLMTESSFSNEVTAYPTANPGRVFVLNTDDAGPGSLREALAIANANGGPDTVTFLIPAGSVIVLQSDLPTITTDGTLIDADVNGDGKPDVWLQDGGQVNWGLNVESANNLIKGLVISGFGGTNGGGVLMWGSGANNNMLLSNYIGTDSSGIFRFPNETGVVIVDGAHSNWIGDGTPQGRNVISGNDYDGIYMWNTHDNRILGNYIGTDVNGLSSVINVSDGIVIEDAYSNWIGDGVPGHGNVVSGNGNNGIFIESFNSEADNNRILGNMIGVGADGMTPVGNGQGDLASRPEGVFGSGMILYAGGGKAASLKSKLAPTSRYKGKASAPSGFFQSLAGTIIGDGTDDGRNIISANYGNGIYLYGDYVYATSIQGNYLGIGADNDYLGNGSTGIEIYNYPYATSVAGNVISNNNGWGISITYADSSVILANKIGVDLTGDYNYGNWSGGIYIYNSSSHHIGDGSVPNRNQISGNYGTGIYVETYFGSSWFNTIDNNLIGTQSDGLKNLGNSGSGVYFFDNSGTSEPRGQGGNISYCTIASNAIAYSGGEGIFMNGFGITENTVSRNSIFSNGGAGIYYLNGAQGGIVPPTVDDLTGNVLSGTSDDDALVEIYVDYEDEGRLFVDTAYADISGNWSKAVPVILNQNYTALQHSFGQSSAFAAPYAASSNRMLVNKLSDDGSPGTLRGAIDSANTHIGADTVQFLLPQGSIINLDYSMNSIMDDGIVIDGDLDHNGTPDITVRASQTGGGKNPKEGQTGMDGFTINSSNNVIKGLVVYGFQQNFTEGGRAFRLSGTTAAGNKILGNHIGTNPDATNDIGIFIEGGAHDNWIGDGTATGRNVISANSGNGIAIQDAGSSGNRILGNYIGTDVAGQNPLPNNYNGIMILSGPMYTKIGDGTPGGSNIISGNDNRAVHIEMADSNEILGNIIGLGTTGNALPNYSGIFLGSGANANRIGNGTAGGRNIVSGNVDQGITIGSVGNTSSYNIIVGNYIGLDPSGNTGIGNGDDGIAVYGGDGGTAVSNVIGDGTAGGRNVISGNARFGIHLFGSVFSTVIWGNYIGLNAAGTSDIGNTESGVYISDGARHNLIGNGTAGAGNVISGNDYYGVKIEGFFTDSNSVFGNTIGLNAAGNTAVGNTFIGLRVFNGARYTMIGNGTPAGRNVISGNGESGIEVSGLDSPQKESLIYTEFTRIVGNYVGTDVSGTTAVGNLLPGVLLESESKHTMLGDGTAGGRNIIAGHGALVDGVLIDCDSNMILGNYIGLNTAGNALPNQTGITVASGSGNQIGDGTTGGVNVISGNSFMGISFEGTLTAAGGVAGGNSVTRNYIGVDPTGLAPRPNGMMGAAFSDGAYGNILVDNTIAFNDSAGIGAKDFGTAGNGFYANKIFRNNGLGGITYRNGGQYELQGPAITSVAFDSTVNGTATPNAFIQIYADSLRQGQGRIWLDSVTAIGTTWARKVNIPSGMVLTALQDSAGTTSMFSAPFTPLLGVLAASAGSLNYGNVLVGDSAVRVVKVYSVNGYTLASSSSLRFGTQYTVSSGPALPDTLFPGDTLTYTIRFRPTSFTTVLDTLTINNSSLVPAFRIPLTGIGTAGTLAVNPATGNFGNVFVGDSVSQTFKIFASTGQVIVSSASLQTGAPYSVVAASAIPDTVKPGDTVSVTIRFRPTAYVTFRDTLNIGNNSVTNPRKLALTGNGTAGTLSSLPAVANFGSVQVGDSAIQNIRIFVTAGHVGVSGMSLGIGAPYSIVSSPSLPDTLSVGDTITVSVKFKPTTDGGFADTLNVANNTLPNPFAIPLTGNGNQGILAADMTTVDYGDVYLGDSTTHQVKLYVTSGTVLVNTAALTGGAPYYITGISTSLPVTLQTNDTLFVDVRFRPDAVGPTNDVLSFTNNSASNPFTINLSGSGISGTIAASATAVDFGSVVVGDSLIRRVEVYATAGQVEVQQIVQGVGGAVDFVLVNPPVLPQVLRSGTTDTLRLEVKFMPVSAGAKADTIKLYSNAAQGEVLILLGGSATVNSNPNPFALQGLPNGGLINTVLPTLTWENNGDPEGQTLTYYVEIARDAAMTDTAQTSWSGVNSLTLNRPLDSLASYYWRVTAYDGFGGSSTAPVGFFRVDVYSPELYTGVLASTLLPNYLDVYAYSGEELRSAQAKFVFTNASNQPDSTTVAMSEVTGDRGLYYTKFHVTSAQTLTIRTTVTDSANNVTTQSRTFQVIGLGKAGGVLLAGGELEITAERNMVQENGFLLIRVLESEVIDVPESMQKYVSPVTMKEDWTSLGRYELLSTVPIVSGKRLTLRFSYTQEDVTGLQALYPDFDERKLGVYREESGGWVYAGGEGRSLEVSAKTGVMGRVGAWYNPEHVYLPEKLELLQNYPNPFNPTTTIKFGLPQEGRVKLVVYNVLGQKVKELLRESREAGYHEVRWDGRSSTGHRVSSGLYIYRLETPMGVVSRKMMMVK